MRIYIQAAGCWWLADTTGKPNDRLHRLLVADRGRHVICCPKQKRAMLHFCTMRFEVSQG